MVLVRKVSGYCYKRASWWRRLFGQRLQYDSNATARRLLTELKESLPLTGEAIQVPPGVCVREFGKHYLTNNQDSV